MQALLNFSSLVSNRQIMLDASGIPKLEALLSRTNDATTRKNIEGIVYRLLTPNKPKKMQSVKRRYLDFMR